MHYGPSKARLHLWRNCGLREIGNVLCVCVHACVRACRHLSISMCVCVCQTRSHQSKMWRFKGRKTEICEPAGLFRPPLPVSAHTHTFTLSEGQFLLLKNTTALQGHNFYRWLVQLASTLIPAHLVPRSRERSIGETGTGMSHVAILHKVWVQRIKKSISTLKYKIGTS